MIHFVAKMLTGVPALRTFMQRDDVIKWKHFPRNWPFVPVNSPRKDQSRGALMFSLIRA